MATFTRRNAWDHNGTFDNPDLLWYAMGVREMQSRFLDDPTSWWFFAAIHGDDWRTIMAPPKVPVTPRPSQSVIDQYWAQCQHGSWYFPPWHRGYLYAIENILRQIIKDIDGPDDWALPYWNYFGPGDEFKIPPAFTEQTLPDGSANPLLVDERYGPNNDRNIFIPLAFWGITQECQRKTEYTGAQPDYYGGEVTLFEHSDYDKRGSLEDNPHNIVHGAIGGQTPSGLQGGLMSDPETAALDPVFYLHHCNIDRMWAAWNADGKDNPTDPDWLNGPTAVGERMFYMPKPDQTPWKYTPSMVNDISQLDYTYDDLSLGVPSGSLNKNALRLRNFGLTSDESKLLGDMNLKANSELVGANNGAIKLDAKGVRTTVDLDTRGWRTVAKSLTNAKANLRKISDANNFPDQVYLQLEGVKGKEDSIVCSVSVNQKYAGHISLFGLRNASKKDSKHGASGLTIRLDITKIVDQLHMDNHLDLNSLDVLIQPVNVVAEGNELTIDRVSVYRKGQL